MYTGTNRNALLLAQRLPAFGYTTEVVLPDEGVFADRLRAEGVAVSVVPVPAALGLYGRSTKGWHAARALLALPGYWWRLRRHLQAHQGVVHVTSHRSALLAAPAARLAGRPVLWQVSGIEDDRWASVLCDLLATRTVAVSEAARAVTVRRGRVQTIVPPALDPRFDDIAPMSAAKAPIVVTVGRLEPVKGHPLLLEAFTMVLDRIPEARLRIVGGDQAGHEGYADRIRHAAAKIGQPGTVEFTGWVEEPEQRCTDAAVYVSSSRREGMGLALVEALACGLPVVFTADTGLAGFIEPGRSALVVPSCDARALAAAIVRVLEDRAFAARLAAAGREASRRFALATVAAEFAGVLDELIDGSRQR